MVLRKAKTENKTLFIDATKECVKVTNNNKLTDENIQKILGTYESKKDIQSNQTLSKSINIKSSEIAFELKDEVTGEILYYWEDGNSYWKNRLILVSYFIKQKEKYFGENLIPDGFTTEREDLKKLITIEDENGKKCWKIRLQSLILI